MQTNPFNPTFGDVPKVYLDAEHRADKMVRDIETSEYARSIFITGVRGSGKTSFMTQVEKKLSANSRCHCIDLINDESLLDSFVSQLNTITHNKLARLMRNISNIGIGKLSVTIEKDGEVGNDVLGMVRELMEEVKKHGEFVLVTIDEVDNSKTIRSFAQIFNELKRHSLPIYILMTGLPDLVMDVQNEKKLTFLLRSQKEVMSPLQKSNMVMTYQRIFQCETSVAVKMVKMVQGYSYAFQLLGYHAYREIETTGENLTMETLKKVKDAYAMNLFENAYQKIFADLSEVDQKYLIAVLGNKQLKEVAAMLHCNSSYASQYRRRAIARHLVVPSSFGHVQYTLPYFEEFIKATQDPNSMYYYYIEWDKE